MQLLRTWTACLLLVLGTASAFAQASSNQGGDAERLTSPAASAYRSGVHSIIQHHHARGEHTEAVRWARQGIDAGCGYCLLYYADAVLNGWGVPKDERQAFQLFSEMKGEMARVRLARLYADGIGTARDPIEAYALLSITTGPCDNCEGTGSEALALRHRLERELSRDQIKAAIARAHVKDPDLADRLWWDKVAMIALVVVMLMIGLMAVVLVGLLVWGVHRTVNAAVGDIRSYLQERAAR